MVSRYLNDTTINQGKILSTGKAVPRIRRAFRQGRIRTREVTLKEFERLDQIAGRELNNSSFWWMIAALSDIGWCLQVPPGTIIRVPIDAQDVLRFV